MSIQIIHGDCRTALEFMASCSVDSIVTDPPYALESISKRFAKSGRTDSTWSRSGPHQRTARGFMGKQWDTGEVAFDPDFWRDALRVLKPGGHVLAFGGTRTYHRLATAIEDAGFEIRDQIGWLYGSGFPKSSNQHGDWEGWGTALKPAWEPIVVARKALDGTVAQNLAKWGLGALNIDGCRVEADDGANRARPPRTANTILGGGKGTNLTASHHNDIGRWPANVIHDGSDEVSVALGAPMRFFYGAKASKSDRDDGLAHRDLEAVSDGRAVAADNAYQRGKTLRANIHPTVKPTDLMRYLPRLVTPPGGTVLDPFMGSGSTGRGAVLEGFNFIGCELDSQYVAIARARIAAVQSSGSVFD